MISKDHMKWITVAILSNTDFLHWCVISLCSTGRGSSLVGSGFCLKNMLVLLVRIFLECSDGSVRVGS